MTSDRPSSQEPPEPPHSASPSHPTKYPSTDRMAIRPASTEAPREDLAEAVRSFDPAKLRAWDAAAKEERLEVIALFPLADWPTMPLERYALGTPNSGDSFCRWMEFATPHLPSIKGGSALKHLIFKRKDAGDSGAKRVLMPSENKRDIADVPDELLNRIQPVFYTDPMHAAIRALGLE